MEIFQHDGINGLPSIELDKRGQVFEIKGTSFPEDSTAFYSPVFSWLNNFLNNPEKKLNVVFMMEYFNTSTSKIFQNFIEIFEKIHKNGTMVNVKWLYRIDDEEMYEAGLGYAERIKFPFELVEQE